MVQGTSSRLAEVFMQESDLHRRCFLESWFIQRNVTMNREAGSLSSAYNALCDC